MSINKSEIGQIIKKALSRRKNPVTLKQLEKITGIDNSCKDLSAAVIKLADIGQLKITYDCRVMRA